MSVDLKPIRKKLVLLGASGNAHDVLDIVEAINAKEFLWEIAGILDDGIQSGSHVFGHKVLGPLSMAGTLKDCFYINCIGNERSFKNRVLMIDRLMLRNEQFATLIHPQASVSFQASLGCGVYVSFGSSIGGGSVLGNHVSVAPGVIIGHDSRIENFTVLAPGAAISGFVSIGEASYLGARCVIKQRLRVGERALVGMGAVVTRDVDSETIVTGVPARVVPQTVKQTVNQTELIR